MLRGVWNHHERGEIQPFQAVPALSSPAAVEDPFHACGIPSPASLFSSLHSSRVTVHGSPSTLHGPHAHPERLRYRPLGRRLPRDGDGASRRDLPRSLRRPPRRRARTGDRGRDEARPADGVGDDRPHRGVRRDDHGPRAQPRRGHGDQPRRRSRHARLAAPPAAHAAVVRRRPPGDDGVQGHRHARRDAALSLRGDLRRPGESRRA